MFRFLTAVCLLCAGMSGVSALDVETISGFSIEGSFTTRYDKTLQRLFIAADGALIADKGIDESFRLEIPKARGVRDGSADFVIRADLALDASHLLQATGDVVTVGRLELRKGQLTIVSSSKEILLDAGASETGRAERLGSVAIASFSGEASPHAALDQAVDLERKRLGAWLQGGSAALDSCAGASRLGLLEQAAPKCNCPVCTSCGAGHAGIICPCTPGDGSCRATDSVTCVGGRGFACCQCGAGGALCGCLEACYPTNPP